MRRPDARMALLFALEASASALSGLLPAVGVLLPSVGFAAATTIGDPLDDEHLMGPLVDGAAVATMMQAIETAKGQGARVHRSG